MAAIRFARLRRARDRRGARWRRPASPGCAALAIAAGPDGGDPLRSAAPRSRSPQGPMAATRFARLRRARDRRAATRYAFARRQPRYRSCENNKV
jgi:hypothetical protein